MIRKSGLLYVPTTDDSRIIISEVRIQAGMETLRVQLVALQAELAGRRAGADSTEAVAPDAWH